MLSQCYAVAKLPNRGKATFRHASAYAYKQRRSNYQMLQHDSSSPEGFEITLREQFTAIPGGVEMLPYHQFALPARVAHPRQGKLVLVITVFPQNDPLLISTVAVTIRDIRYHQVQPSRPV